VQALKCKTAQKFSSIRIFQVPNFFTIKESFSTYVVCLKPSGSIKIPPLLKTFQTSRRKFIRNSPKWSSFLGSMEKQILGYLKLLKLFAQFGKPLNVNGST
jgi:hypothetical protein